MTRVLITADTVGGVWQYATELAAALVPLGWEPVVATIGPRPTRTPAVGEGVRLVETDLPLDWLCDGPEPVLAAGRALARLAREVEADVVHVNSPSLLAAGPLPAPALAAVHGCIGTWWDAAFGGEPSPDYAWLDTLNGRGLANADAVVAPSESYALAVARHHRLAVKPLAIHNGRTPFTLPEAAEPATGVFTAGRLWDPVKNTALLDRVAARLDVPFEAAGPLAGPHGETVSPADLRTLGNLSEAELAARLAARPVFVSAALFEPFGLAVLEAAQAGCPLVLSGIDTFRELWTGAALIVPEDDEAGFAAAIERVLGDAELRHHLSEAARIRAGRYTPALTAAATGSIYAGLVGDAQKAAA